jgi:hypothetical protein
MLKYGQARLMAKGKIQAVLYGLENTFSNNIFQRRMFKAIILITHLWGKKNL